MSEDTIMQLGAVWAGSSKHYTLFKERIVREARDMVDAGQIELLGALNSKKVEEGLHVWYDVKVIDPVVLEERDI